MSDKKPPSFAEIMQALKEPRGEDLSTSIATVEWALAAMRENFEGDDRRDRRIARQIAVAIYAVISRWTKDLKYDFPFDLGESGNVVVHNVLDAALRRTHEQDIQHVKKYMALSLCGMAIALTGGEVPDDFFSFDWHSTD